MTEQKAKTRDAEAETEGVAVALAFQPLAPERRPQPQGGYLLAGGLPGHKGANGKITAEFKDWCRLAATSEDVRSRILKELVAPGVFPVKLWETLMLRAFGTIPVQAVEERSLTITVRNE